jgi:hypothetical protein
LGNGSAERSDRGAHRRTSSVGLADGLPAARCRPTPNSRRGIIVDRPSRVGRLGQLVPGSTAERQLRGTHCPGDFRAPWSGSGVRTWTEWVSRCMATLHGPRHAGSNRPHEGATRCGCSRGSGTTRR